MVKARASFAIRPKLKKAIEKAARASEITVSQYLEKMVEEAAEQKGVKE